jgi:hypothetical protein
LKNDFQRLTCVILGGIWVKCYNIDESALPAWVDQEHPEWAFPVNYNATTSDTGMKPFKLGRVQKVRHLKNNAEARPARILGFHSVSYSHSGN